MNYKKIIFIFLLCCLEPLNAKVGRKGITVPQPEINPVQAQVKPTPFIRQRKAIKKPESYAQALEIIRTKMPSDQVLKNNVFTQSFIDFVKSINISKIEKQALLQAGAHIHATWSDDLKTNDRIIESLDKSIENIIDRAPQKHVIHMARPVVEKKQKQAQAQQLPQQPEEELYIRETLITFEQGDITKQNVDAIVNAANEHLGNRGGVARAIRDAAGQKFQNYCNEMPIVKAPNIKCQIGEAVITPAFNLQKVGIKNIINTVGPLGSNPDKEILLRNAYQNSLKIAQKNNLRSIAFPAISTAIFGYDINKATPVAFAAVRDFVKSNPKSFDEIRFVLFSNDDMNVYEKFSDELRK